MRVEFSECGGGRSPRPDAVVLKFGSSVLRTAADLPLVGSEIYRHVRDGRKVVAVVSALAGETDALIATARAAGAGEGSRHAPRLIALGEEKSASLLAIACEAIGVNARVLGARALSLEAGGPVDDAEPKGVDADLLCRELSERDVVIVPGFVAMGATGEPVLLGRGGSDLTAVFLSAAIGLGEATLVKDVDAVYDRDPAKFPSAALRYSQLDYQTAREVAGKLLQPKAIDFAERHGVILKVARLNGAVGASVGEESAPPVKHQKPRRLGVAVAGLGTIGEGAAMRIAADENDYRLTAALVADASKTRAAALRSTSFHETADGLLGLWPEIIVDALPDGRAGRALIRAALKEGVSVVTANKQAIAGALGELTALAAASNATLSWSASVGGGAPIVETLRRARAAGEVLRIEAILNGTVNFVLTRLAAGDSFDDAVAKTQDAGFAEPDPTADLSGADVQAKLSILSFDAFGREIPFNEIMTEALTPERAEALKSAGGEWRQIARIERAADGKLKAQIAFENCDADPFFAETRNEENAARIHLQGGGAMTARGRGAGRRPTVESLLGDLGAIRRERSDSISRQSLTNPLQESELVG